MPYFLERIDYVYQHHKAWTGQDFGDKLPSQVFLERTVLCFIDDAFGVENRHHLNMENIMLGVRLPALGLDVADGAGARDEVPRRTCRTTEINKITYENAMRIFQLRPVRTPADARSARSRRSAPRGGRRGHGLRSRGKARTAATKASRSRSDRQAPRRGRAPRGSLNR